MRFSVSMVINVKIRGQDEVNAKIAKIARVLNNAVLI